MKLKGDGRSGGAAAELALAATPEAGAGSPPWILLLAFLLPGMAGATIVAVRSRRHRALPAGEVADLELRELAAALPPAGWAREGRSTLLKLEERLRIRRLPSAAAYVRRLRELRYGRGTGRAPSLAERRATRRELAAGGGAGRTIRMLIAMPPGGPRRHGR